MSRCKACDAPLYKRDTPSHNKNTHQEDDLCASCRTAVRCADFEHEYTGGNNPTDGLTPPGDVYD